jgi:hypothetical protein
VFPAARNDGFRRYFSGMTPLMLAASMPQLRKAQLEELESKLAAVRSPIAVREGGTIPSH